MLTHAAEYASAYGLSEDAVIKKIRDGDLVGYEKNGNWFVDAAPSGAGPDSEYSTARKVAGFLSVAGWIIVALGVLGALLFTLALEFGGVLSGLFAVVSGLLVVAAGYILEATVDTAEHTKSILALLSKQTRPESL
jgi:hypothetical protein